MHIIFNIFIWSMNWRSLNFPQKKFQEPISLSHFKMLNDFPPSVKIWKLYIINDWSPIIHGKKEIWKLVHFWWRFYHNMISSLDNNERLYWTNKNPLSKIKWINVKFSKLNDIINARMQICFSRLPNPPDSLFWQV